jgi:hypothetical protein
VTRGILTLGVGDGLYRRDIDAPQQRGVKIADLPKGWLLTTPGLRAIEEAWLAQSEPRRPFTPDQIETMYGGRDATKTTP